MRFFFSGKGNTLTTTKHHPAKNRIGNTNHATKLHTSLPTAFGLKADLFEPLLNYFECSKWNVYYCNLMVKDMS